MPGKRGSRESPGRTIGSVWCSCLFSASSQSGTRGVLGLREQDVKGGVCALTSPALVPQSHCEPPSYRPMHHEDFKEDLKKFRTKSRTWAGEKSKREMYSRLKKL